MKKSALTSQVGGDHYKRMKYQPAQFLCKLHVAFNPGAIVKYVSRDKADELEDLRKAMHFCDICADLKEKDIYMRLRKLFGRCVDWEIWNYCRMNTFRYQNVRFSIIHDALLGNWKSAKENIQILIDLYVEESKRKVK